MPEQARPGYLPSRYVSLFSLAALFIGGCTVGPKYVRPTTDIPPAYKESPDFKLAQPSDGAPKGDWWEIYGDPKLDALEDQVSVSNQTLKATQEQFVQARAAIRFARSSYFPQGSVGVSASRSRISANHPLFTAKSPYNDFQLPGDVSYEPDVWGRVRRTVEAARSEAQASAADLASISLSLHAELAADYFQLRGLDSQAQLLDSTVLSYEKALDLTRSRYEGGVASAVDLAQAQTQLETTKAEAIDVRVQRSGFEHALAVLIGKPASSFSLPPQPLTSGPPDIPPDVPSALLERRPDIAAAERRVEEANAGIGVARAAFFPAVLLGATGGFESGSITTLVQGPSGFWSLAGSAAELVFEGGQRHALAAQARSAYEQSVDQYRQTTLTAIQEVEDNLAALRILRDEAKTADAAVAAAQHSLDLSTTRYRGGVTSYLEVTTAQSAALADEVSTVDILTRRMVASVLLVKALGGSWNVSQIPRL